MLCFCKYFSLCYSVLQQFSLFYSSSLFPLTTMFTVHNHAHDNDLWAKWMLIINQLLSAWLCLLIWRSCDYCLRLHFIGLFLFLSSQEVNSQKEFDFAQGRMNFFIQITPPPPPTHAEIERTANRLTFSPSLHIHSYTLKESISGESESVSHFWSISTNTMYQPST